jgi:hypothetical protein
MRGPMKLRLTLVCLVACSNAAWAQDGVSNQRDMYGNLVRDNGPSRDIIQGPVNHGPIRNAPARPATTNTGAPKGASK